MRLEVTQRADLAVRALVAWTVTFIGLLHHLASRRRQGDVAAPQPVRAR